jgi:hypothetical protein
METLSSSIICPVCGRVQVATTNPESKQTVCISCHMVIWEGSGG